MTHRLQGKTALVTGAAQGIGAAIARAFVAEGAFVYVTDLNDELGRAVATELGDSARYLHLDVRDEAQWQQVTRQILTERGRLEVLVNNAGITGFEQGVVAHDPEHARLADWHAVHRTNLDGVFLGCKHGIRAMRPAGAGAIINVSSRSGLVGIPGAAAYASSKAAVRNHSKTVALYCAEQGLAIRCNSIHPAAILTPMWEPMLGDGPDREARMAALVRDTPLRRFGRPAEVAALAVLLASDEAAYMTGSELNLDGGLLAGSAVTPAVVESTWPATP
ncbi:glucose 1-dehydrogenase [Pseudomonas sp. EpS/L25]|uniref:glucose 1-dehydrogenase n=1 Tax=Pseudomonas sp. EpS/L25 TaxID=1749078 RepID=UPI000743F2FB|nr:glucose 1-dehydrogenase [Pseudomonas sp. EpS/L25]KUM40020.1 short-chain dehydrogenase [Pseudomonas sp. EpS/L25]